MGRFMEERILDTVVRLLSESSWFNIEAGPRQDSSVLLQPAWSEFSQVQGRQCFVFCRQREREREREARIDQ